MSISARKHSKRTKDEEFFVDFDIPFLIFIFVIVRILDSVPLYEMLNQFRKGQSHMAVVVKSKYNTKDSTEISTTKNDRFKTNINSISWIQKRVDENGNLFRCFLVL